MKTPAMRDVAELVGLVSIVVTLVVLILEVHDNSIVIEQQSALMRAQAISEPYFRADLASALIKVHDVDGDYGLPARLTERYGMTPAEAVLWERHLWLVWESMEISFIANGGSEKLEKQVRLMLASPSHALYLENARKFQFNREFSEYLVGLQESQAEFLAQIEGPEL